MAKWAIFRVADSNVADATKTDVMLNLDHIESIYPGTEDGTVDIYTRTGVRLEVDGNFADMALDLQAADKRPRDTTPITPVP